MPSSLMEVKQISPFRLQRALEPTFEKPRHQKRQADYLLKVHMKNKFLSLRFNTRTEDTSVKKLTKTGIF